MAKRKSDIEKVEPAPREIIQKRLLDSLEEGDKVAIVFGEQELWDLLKTIILSPRSSHNMLDDMMRLYLVAFTHPKSPRRKFLQHHFSIDIVEGE